MLAEPCRFALRFIGQGRRLLRDQPESTLSTARTAFADFFKERQGPNASVCRWYRVENDYATDLLPALCQHQQAPLFTES